jgi:hypothetical protein
MLIAFEGQDGAGKTSLLHATFLELERLRTRHLVEDRSSDVSAGDLDVFAHRERVMRQLIADAPTQFLTVNNGHVPLSEGVRNVLAFLDAHHTDSRQKGE